ncbi:putative late blight resistance protein -like r1a-6 [Nicotiana attenuata]|uniref:Late blight resistance protein -like r1a-6 n=1 Tax=Nicotiana attenuata TaxID=49451 RepID=A0A1J6IAE8_NICAT|nr:putative late blight resistance protein -like r1a-6 [Nicotiana attenuata]
MAYASVASLMRTMESVLASKSQIKSLVCDHREEFLALQKKVSLLEVCLKNFEKRYNSGKMTDSEEQIKGVANAVERIIQMRLTESVIAKDEMHKEEAHKRLRDSLNQVVEEIDRVQKEATKIQDKVKQASKESLVQDSSSREDIVKVKNKMVGRDYQRKSLLNDLTREFSSEPKVIPIVGMGGIGKTTLANEVFHDASAQHHFDVRAWATVSSQHNVKEIYISLLHWTVGEAFDKEDEADLADMLRKSLKGKRYLIVLDDIWKSKAWDDVRLCFPSENNGSRILLTTRDSEVACYAGTENPSLQMGFMDPDESWNLFKSTVLENEALPSRFETIGKKIIDKCQGLPLTIVVVAGLLSKSERTMEVWEHVAEDVKSFATNDPDEQCLRVLGLSYNHLSSDLKACLLYFVIFPEDTEISMNRLMRLWIAERCLVLVSKKNLDGTKVRSCKVHDLIYELCLREAERKNIFIMNDIVLDNWDLETAQSNDIVFDDELNPVPPKFHLGRHIMRPCKRSTDCDEIDHGSYKVLLTPGHHDLIRRKTDEDGDNILNRTRSILSFHHTSSPFTLKSDLIHFNLLRILDLAPMNIDFFPRQILCLIWLRYLVLCGDYDLPPEIGMLWNLHTVINVIGYKHREVTFPEQIWELMQLRQLRLHKFYLSNPPRESDDKESYLAFSNIHTISSLSPSSCTKEVIAGIRNVKKLVIYGHGNDYKIFQESKVEPCTCS